MKGVKNESFHVLLAEEFGIDDFPADAPPLVAAARHVELATRLKTDGYVLYDFCVATHWEAVKETKRTPADVAHFEVTTGLRSIGQGSNVAVWRVRLELDVPLDTLVGIFAGADWQEREQYDLVGVRFAGHPDLRRLMMPEDWVGHPLRNAYAIDTPRRPWR